MNFLTKGCIAVNTAVALGALLGTGMPGSANAQSLSTLMLVTMANQVSAEEPIAQVTPQICPPAGYVTSDVGGDVGSQVKNGETLYCVKTNSEQWWLRRECTKFGPAEEFIRQKTGRSDAVYSGMAVQGSEQSRIILFYCLPRKR